MYMKDRVGVGELRQNLSKYLRRVEKGERILVTDRNRPVAELGPPLSALSHVDRLVAEGRVKPPRKPRKPGEPFPKRVQLDGGVDHERRATRALIELRGDR